MFFFRISDALRQGRVTALNGEGPRRGMFIERLRIEVFLLSPYNVNLNLGLFGYLREELTESFVARGFLPIQRLVLPTIAGRSVLSVGDAVPFESVQSVLHVLHNAKFPLDVVAYASHIPAYEIELSVSEFAETIDIDSSFALIERLLSARTENAFRDMLSNQSPLPRLRPFPPRPPEG